MAGLTLQYDKIETTLVLLQARIEERFPGRGISRLCGKLLELAREDARKMNWRRRPNLWIRASVLAILAVGVTLVAWAVLGLLNLRVDAEAINALQAVEATFNIIAIGGAAVWFLLNLESIWRREAVLRDLHELRSMAHVVDMHQLTKDPSKFGPERIDTSSSPQPSLTAYELERYLDYCAEMLALTGKLAALFVQDARDPIIIQAVNEIEELTTGLSRKIWQKIMMLRSPGAGG